jgi:hypothetical protein
MKYRKIQQRERKIYVKTYKYKNMKNSRWYGRNNFRTREIKSKR